MTDLLPCPFCGGEAEWKSGGPGSAWVSCKSCPAETGDGAIPRIRDAWNTRALPAVQPDAAAIREAARVLLKASDGSMPLEAKMAAVKVIIAREGKCQPGSVVQAWQAALETLIDNPGGDTIATLYGALAQGQKRLGADFEAAWAENVESLYDNNPGKEVMPDENQKQNIRGSDTAPAGLSAGGGADYDAVREAIRKMVGLRGEYYVEQESADIAIAFLNDMEARNCPAPRLIRDDDGLGLTWVIGGWKLYQYCDEEETQVFRWQGPPATRGGA